jgi:hypothetical protein
MLKKSQNNRSLNDIGSAKVRRVILSHDQRRELDNRFRDHYNGIGKSFTWEETLAMAKELQKLKQFDAKL